MRLTVTEEQASRPTPPRLTVCRARRSTVATNPPFGYDDLPTRLEGEYHSTSDGRVIEWHARASRYETQLMTTWGSYKAMLYMKSIDVVDELGLRVGLCLAVENPDYWP